MHPGSDLFDARSPPIVSIQLVYTGSQTGVGLAFDNFSPSQASVPEPSGWILAGLSVAVAVGLAWRRGPISP